MGFPTALLLQCDERSIDDLVCKVCANLVDYKTSEYTSCTHVFCRSCLSTWLERSSKCPTCNTLLSADRGVQQLSVAAPLAWRLLGKLRCKCPIAEQGCTWTGEYSELDAHLSSSTTHLGIGPSKAPLTDEERAARSAAEADGLKDQANIKYQERAFHEALKLYSKAIAVRPGVAAYYGNRAAAWFMLGAFRESVADCRQAVALDPGFVKGYARLSKALCELGQLDEACAALEECVKARPEAAAALQEEWAHAQQLRALLAQADMAADSGQHDVSAALLAEACRLTSAPAIALKAAAAELARGNPDRVQRITLQLLKADDRLAPAYALRGMGFFQAGDFDQAVKHLREALRLDPDDSVAARQVKEVRRAQAAVDAGRAAAFSRDFEKADAEFTTALSVPALRLPSPLATSLLAERGAARLRLKQPEAAIADCDAAIAAREDCKPAYLTRASALQALSRFDEALAGLKVMAEMDPNDAQVQKHLQKAEFEARKARRPDYYEVLQCARVSTPAEVKNAYKQRAMEWHPDRHSEAPEEKRREAEARFKLIGEALEVLADPLQRQLYDEGHDKQSIDERVAAASRAAHDRSGGRGHAHQHAHAHGDGGCGGGGCGSCG